MTLAPDHGARFELARIATTSDGAHYRVRVQASGAAWTGETTIDTTKVETAWSPSPPKWIESTTHLFFKTLQKNHGHDGSWPSRLVRWRAERSEP